MILVLFISILFSSCWPWPGGGGGAKTAPCDKAMNCLVIRYDGSQCCDYCSQKGKKYTLNNTNPDNIIIASIVQEINKSGVWIQDKILTRRIANNGKLELPLCGISQYLEEPVKDYARYRVADACFEKDAYCNIVYPSNPDLPKFNCYDAFRNQEKSCNEFNSNLLTATERKPLIEFVKAISSGKPDIPLVSNPFAIFPSSDPFCKTRTWSIVSNNLESFGSTCTMSLLSPYFIQLYASGERYKEIWFDFPSVMSAPISYSPSNGGVYTIDFTGDLSKAIWITVKLDPGNTIRQDLIDKIYVTPNYIVISGRDFFCTSIKFNLE